MQSLTCESPLGSDSTIRYCLEDKALHAVTAIAEQLGELAAMVVIANFALPKILDWIRAYRVGFQIESDMAMFKPGRTADELPDRSNLWFC